MTRFVRDVQYGARMLLKSPGLTAVAALTLALGIGANTALYSVATALLKSTPGVTQPEKMVAIVGITTTKDAGYGLLPYSDYFEYREATDVFSGVTASRLNILKVTHDMESALVPVEVVRGNYFDVLGIRSSLGRTFRADETEAESGPPIAVLGYAAWQHRFAAAPDIIGRSVKLNGQEFTVIGVAPKGFIGLYRGTPVEFWVPTSAYDALYPSDAGALAVRGRAYWSFLARLQGGVSLEQAQTRVTGIAERLSHDYPATNQGITARVLFNDVGDPNQSRQLRFAVFAFMALGGLVLLVACANVCNLLLARAQARHREVAIRAALGASRARLVRQLLTESLLLAVVGGMMGLLVAAWTVDLVSRWRPEIDIPIDYGFVIDTGAVGYAALLLVLATLLFGMVPAFRLSSLNLVSALKGDGSGDAGSRRRLSSGLVIAQVGTAFVLLIISGLLVQSLRAAERVDLGFTPKGVLASSLNLNLEKYERSSWQPLYRDLRERLAALPGVTSVSLSQGTPILTPDAASFFAEGASGSDRDRQQAALMTVDPHFFETLRIPLRRGRDFAPTDDKEHPAVVIVNQSLAEHYWPGQDPLGRVLRLHTTDGQPLQVVGVVADSKYNSVTDDRPRCLFVSLYQNDMPQINISMRTAGEPAHWAKALRGAIREMDPEMLLVGVQPYDTFLQQVGNFFLFRLAATFAFTLAALALVLALVGLYGLIAFGVSQKTHEVGVRMALGAEAGDVLWIFIRRGLMLTSVGLAAGLLLALGATRLIQSALWGVSATDTSTFVAVPLVFLVVALTASYLPARRATRVDPMVALRCE